MNVDLTCADCGSSFFVTEAARAGFEARGQAMPKRCFTCRSARRQRDRLHGTVGYFDEQRGFFFIDEGVTGERYYATVGAVSDRLALPLAPGERVSFEVMMTAEQTRGRHPRAWSVKVVDNGQAS
jgi:cold shock CspA family protein